jgi:predicted DNA-binding transcriptional regulator AlpA
LYYHDKFGFVNQVCRPFGAILQKVMGPLTTPPRSRQTASRHANDDAKNDMLRQSRTIVDHRGRSRKMSTPCFCIHPAGVSRRNASSPALQNNGNDDDDAGLADIPARNSSPPQKPVQTMVRRVIDASPQASPAESEMAIGSRRYVSARRVASMLGVSLRTLSRWDAAGTGPPKIKIGKKVFFYLGKISEWLASRGIPSTRVTGQN